MKLEHKKIAIIGGGPGGLTLARLLQLENVHVSVYERDVNQYARVQGSPLDLHHDSGLAAIVKTGLLDAFKDNFMSKADRTKIMNEHATVFYSDHETKLEEHFGSMHFRPEIDRGVLRKILLSSLQTGTVIWDSHFVSMEKKDNGWLLHFKNKETAYADIVIAADGANSKTRPYITEIKSVYSGIMMLEGNIYDAKNAAPRIATLLNGGKIMAFGDTKNILLGQKGNGEIGFYLSFRAPENWVAERGLNLNDRVNILQWFKEAYPEWSSSWHELFESTELPFVPRPIYFMPLDQTWEPLHNLTMLGDAAHVMPPFAGEGVNMAMRDALELSHYLTSDDCDNIHHTIALYESGMRERAATMAKESLENGERMHSARALENMLEFFGGH